ncbi:MAG: hypothetical protein ACKVIN_16230, partial [Longimicrobiales bacterium]
AILSRHEGFWVGRLSATEPPHVAQASSTAASTDRRRLTLEVPRAIGEAFGSRSRAAVVAGLAFYLARTGRKEFFHLAAVDSHGRAALEGAERFYSASVPLEVSLDASWSVTEAVDAVATELALLADRPGYLVDVLARTPGLSASGAELPVGVVFGEAKAPASSLL